MQQGHDHNSCGKYHQERKNRTARGQQQQINLMLDSSTILSANTAINSSSWYLDSGTSGHIVGEKVGLINYTPINSTSIQLSNDTVIQATSKAVSNSTPTLGMKNCKSFCLMCTTCPPLTKISSPLIALSSRDTSCTRMRSGWSSKTRIWDKFFLLQNPIRGFFTFNAMPIRYQHPTSNNSQSFRSTPLLLKSRFSSYTNNSSMPVSSDFAPPPDWSTALMFGDLDFCESCVKGKQLWKPIHKGPVPKAVSILMCIESDVCGPMSTVLISRCRYFALFINNCSWFATVHFLCKKSEVYEKIKAFEEMVHNQFNCCIKCLHSDFGGIHLEGVPTTSWGTWHLLSALSTLHSPTQWHCRTIQSFHNGDDTPNDRLRRDISGPKLPRLPPPSSIAFLHRPTTGWSNHGGRFGR